MSEITQPIPARLKNVAVNGHVAGAADIIDDSLNRTQAVINAMIDEVLGDGGNVAFIDDDDPGQAVIPSFDPESQSVHVTSQVLSEQQKAQVRTNIGLNDVDTRISNAVASEASQRQAQVNGVESEMNTKFQQYDTAIGALNGSDVVVGALPQSGETNKVYRVPNDPTTNKYTDYGWDGTQFVALATYPNDVDDEPTAGSNNLVKSGGVAGKIALLNKELYGYTEEFKYTTTASVFDVLLSDIDGTVGVNILFSFSGSASIGTAVTQRIGSTNGANQPIVSKGDGLYELTWNALANPDCDAIRFWITGDTTSPSNFIFYGDTTVGLEERFNDFSKETSESINKLYYDIIPSTFIKKKDYGTSFTLSDHVVGLPLASLNKNAFIHNTNIITADLFEAEANTTSTKSFTLHGKARYLITHENIIKVLKLHTYYCLSCDYEIKSVDSVAETNRVGFTMGFVDLPASDFVVGKTGHIESWSVVTDQANLDAKSLVYYTGTHGAESLATVEFKNFRIVVGKTELPWEEADNIFYNEGDAMPILNNPIQVIQCDEDAIIEYYSKNENNTVFTTNQFVKSICHRGYSQLAPEDTEPAYVYAKKMGFIYAENDLWFTSDGVPVMVHARDLSLVTDGTGNVDEVTYAYFKSLDFGMGATYGNKYDGLKGLSFDEWILLMKTLGITPFVDVKAITPEPVGGDSVVLLKSILDKYNMTDKVIWAVGFTGAARLRNVIANAKIGITLSSTPTDQEIESCADFLIDNDPDSAFIFIDTNHLTASVVERCHAAGVGCYAWKADPSIIDHPDEVVGYVKLGIDGLVSDGANVSKNVDNYFYDLYDVE